MPITYHDVEEEVEKAVNHLLKQNCPNIRAAARKFGVPRNRLQRRLYGTHRSKIEAGGQNKALDKAAERALYTYIDFTEDLRMSIREKALLNTANSILRFRYKGSGLPRKLSKIWPARWLRVHPKYRKKTLKLLAIARKNIYNLEGIQQWFRKLAAVRQKYNILD
jgi:Tc5 transposase DNA-binding domain